MLSTRNNIDFSIVWNKKYVKFICSKKKYTAISYIIKLIYSVFVFRENIDSFMFTAERRDLIQRLSLILTGFPITTEFETIGI